jgi:DNA mismatch endonuclease (patch repair protein)
MRSLLRKADIPFKMYPKIEGKPDFVVRENITIFCDSSFWHGRNWRILKTKLARGSNAAYWVAHISRNRRRDLYVNRLLRKRGYQVLRFWDNEIAQVPEQCMQRIKGAIARRRHGAGS